MKCKEMSSGYYIDINNLHIVSEGLLVHEYAIDSTINIYKTRQVVQQI